MDADELIAAWGSRGERVVVGDDEVFVADVPAAGEAAAPPLLVLHGFPTSSIDFASVIDALAAGRRVVLVDLPGYGLSTKADRAYSLFEQADVLVQVVTGRDGLHEVDLLTHDMGDSVGGELLARGLDGDLPFTVRRRVVTNGSIYLGMAQLTAGQQLLESLPDEQLPEEAGPDVAALVASLTATLAPTGAPDPVHVEAAAALVHREGGARLLPRLIRYLDERRAHEERWTGAIESHPAPLAVVWGDQDPIAVWDMAVQLAERRADAALTRLEGVGHYPMVEAPAAFATATLAHLDAP